MGLLNKLNVDGLLGKLQKATADLLTNDDAYADRSCNNSSGEKVFLFSLRCKIECCCEILPRLWFCSRRYLSRYCSTSSYTGKPDYTSQEYAGVMINAPTVAQLSHKQQQSALIVDIILPAGGCSLRTSL